MKSGKEKRKEIKARRLQKARKLADDRDRKKRLARTEEPGAKTVVNPALLAPTNSYGIPDFQDRGFYLDKEFRCKDCGKEEIWTATQQKWWYEVAKGDVWTTAVRCRSCRRKERKRKEEARTIHLEGIEQKYRDTPRSTSK